MLAGLVAVGDHWMVMMVTYFLDDELALGDLVEQHAGRSTEVTSAVDA